MPGVFALLKQSISFLKKHFKSLALLGLVLAGYNIIFALIMNITGIDNIDPKTNLAGFFIGFLVTMILAIAGAVLGFLFTIALTKKIGQLDNGGAETTVKIAYKESLSLFWPLIWVTILTSLVNFGGMVLFIIPGIALAVYLLFINYALVLDGKRGLSALGTSFYYVRGSWWKVFWRQLAVALICLVIGLVIGAIVFAAMAAMGVSLFASPEATKAALETWGASALGNLLGIVMWLIWACVLYPIFVIYNYSIYKHLKTLKPEPNPETDLKKPRGWFIGLSIWGLISPIIFAIVLVSTVALLALDTARLKAQNAAQNPQTVVEQINLKSPFPVLSTPLVAIRADLLEPQAFKSKNFNFTIQLPKGWGALEEVDGVTFTPPLKDKIGTSLRVSTKVISTQDLQGQAIDDTFMSAVASGYASTVEKPEDLVYKKYSVSSHTAYVIQREVVFNDGVRGILDVYFIPVGNIIYVVELLADEDVPIQTVNLLVDSISTFKALK